MCLGIPGQIIAITDSERQMALAEIAGVTREVNVACIEDGPLETLVGAWALIHVGFAMSRIDEEQAAITLEALQALGDAAEELEAMQASERALGTSA